MIFYPPNEVNRIFLTDPVSIIQDKVGDLERRNAKIVIAGVKSQIINRAGDSLLSCHGFVIFLIFWYLFCNQVLL